MVVNYQGFIPFWPVAVPNDPSLSPLWMEGRFVARGDVMQLLVSGVPESVRTRGTDRRTGTGTNRDGLQTSQCTFLVLP